MARTWAILLFSLSLFIATVSGAHACKLGDPGIWLSITDTATCDEYLETYANYEKRTDIEYARLFICTRIHLRDWGDPQEQANDVINSLRLDSVDKTNILTLYKELESYTEYRYISKQDANEYEAFVEKTGVLNNDLCNCEKRKIINRVGDWTSYEESFKDTCNFSTACYTPPFPCNTKIVDGNGNRLVIIGAIVSMFIIVPLTYIIFTYFRKRKIKSR